MHCSYRLGSYILRHDLIIYMEQCNFKLVWNHISVNIQLLYGIDCSAPQCVRFRCASCPLKTAATFARRGGGAPCSDLHSAEQLIALFPLQAVGTSCISDKARVSGSWCILSKSMSSALQAVSPCPAAATAAATATATATATIRSPPTQSERLSLGARPRVVTGRRPVALSSGRCAL